MQKTIECDGVTITLRRKTWSDEIAFVSFHNKLLSRVPEGYEKDPLLLEETLAKLNFAKLAAQSVSLKGLKGYRLPVPTMTAEELEANWRQLADGISIELVQLWVDALTELNAPLNDPKLVPPELLTEQEREDFLARVSNTEAASGTG